MYHVICLGKRFHIDFTKAKQHYLLAKFAQLLTHFPNISTNSINLQLFLFPLICYSCNSYQGHDGKLFDVVGGVEREYVCVCGCVCLSVGVSVSFLAREPHIHRLSEDLYEVR